MTTATAQIANHLNVVESAIAAIEEWAHVLFVRFTTGRPRFVSKKVVKSMSQLDQMRDEYLESEAVKHQDAWIDAVDAMVGRLGAALPVTATPTENVLQRVAADVVDGKITVQEALNRLTNKKIVTLRK